MSDSRNPGEDFHSPQKKSDNIVSEKLFQKLFWVPEAVYASRKLAFRRPDTIYKVLNAISVVARLSK
ncbi:hypothetical protein [Leptospira noguchii]|uniref:Uncharacterized protein n=1 Tax=Leptospira noguchii TaxID=28182 RepID=A0A9Q8VVW9_9LEPT|nr:hypothetical protein [Leptospira noguchii]TQE78752.1 hypothetical protein FF021_06275 [Leptospira noguchii]UOG51369.1 hypothetical protein MAL09_11670 [Leptospira noguchii]UOG57941.1 hypothetical protein MAL03_07460 [Leptospira noguchii]